MATSAVRKARRAANIANGKPARYDHKRDPYASINYDPTKHQFTFGKADKFYPGETVLPDDKIIIGNYLYIFDNIIARADHHKITVRQYKGRMKIKEIRRCDLFARQNAVDEAKSQ